MKEEMLQRRDNLIHKRDDMLLKQLEQNKTKGGKTYKLCNRVLDTKPRVAVMPLLDGVKHCLSVLLSNDDPND